MRQLSAVDASFLYLETPRTPMHVSALQVYDPGTAPNGRFEFERFVENVRTRYLAINCYHERLQTFPGGWDHPYWVETRNFDVTENIDQVTLKSPGDWPALCQLTAELHAKPLDRKKPLWQMTVITGLGNIHGFPAGSYAVLTSLHHAAVDGMAGIGATAVLHDLEANPEHPLPLAAATETTTRPSGDWTNMLDMWTRWQWKNATQPLRWFNLVPRLPGSAWTSRPAAAPETRLNQSVSGDRTFDAIDLPLDTLKATRDLAAGATINDVLLCIVAGGLRRLLAETLPAASLTALLPVDRHGSDAATEGNRLAQMIVSMHSDIADPVLRLEAITASTREAKTTTAKWDSRTLADMSELPPAAWSAAVTRNLATAASPSPLFNTIVSNVKAPPITFYSCGSRMIRAYALGPLSHGMGLFHTAVGYGDVVTLSAVSSGNVLGDVSGYAVALQQAFDELVSRSGC